MQGRERMDKLQGEGSQGSRLMPSHDSSLAIEVSNLSSTSAAAEHQGRTTDEEKTVLI